jgi:hypothetical protein
MRSAHFIGEVSGQRGKTSRVGSKASGLRTMAASWAGSVHTTLYVNAQGFDCFRVEQKLYRGVGVSELIADGVLGQHVRRH